MNKLFRFFVRLYLGRINWIYSNDFAEGKSISGVYEFLITHERDFYNLYILWKGDKTYVHSFIKLKTAQKVAKLMIQ